jgi:hypothetical protein
MPPHPPFAPLVAGALKPVSLMELLTAESLSEARIAMLLDRHQNPLVAVAPSHGDFIYWNLLLDGTNRPGLVDFELSSPCRVIGFDDVHTRLAPWFYRAERWNVPANVARVFANYQTRRVCKTFDLPVSAALLRDLFFVHYSGIARDLYRQIPDDGEDKRILARRIDASDRQLGFRV